MLQRHPFAALLAFLRPGATNTSTSGNFQSDIVNYIQDEVEPLARRQLVAYQFGKPLHLDINRGTTYTATRFERLPLPFAPLQEGVAPVGEAVSLVQVSAVAQQWGDSVIVTDVAPRFMGDEREDMMIDAGAYRDPSKSPAVMQHYVALIHPLPAQDMRENAQVNTAWAYSDKIGRAHV